jgi:hypothetical protein
MEYIIESGTNAMKIKYGSKGVSIESTFPMSDGDFLVSVLSLLASYNDMPMSGFGTFTDSVKRVLWSITDPVKSENPSIDEKVASDVRGPVTSDDALEVGLAAPDELLAGLTELFAAHLGNQEVITPAAHDCV